ncbi:MAG: hypothetical protein IIA48_07390, partial [Bacteroidetes bacterium]|nr:hypothetical protein [Bacteroidota bacterium]
MNLYNLIKKLSLLLIVLFFTAGSVFGQTTYYVDGVAGDDSWTGTAVNNIGGDVGPMKTIQAMLDDAKVGNGDIISIAAATYAETVTLTKRVQLNPTGAITVTNITLNTGSTTAVVFGNAASNLTISGTLLVQSGKYTLTTANVIVASGGTLEIRVATTGTTGLQSAVTTTAGNFTLTFSNSSALTIILSDLSGNLPGDVNFNGAGAVTLGAALTAQGNVTIATGASVALVGLNLSTDGNFTNNGSYSATGAAGKVVMTAAKTISGSGTFQNLTFTGANTKTLGSNLTFSNVSQATASLIDVAAGALDFANFNITTPGNITFAGGTAVAYTNVTTGGKLIFSGSLSTVTFNNAAVLANLRNLTINKPSGSTVVLAGGNLTVTNLFDFTGGLLNIGAFDLTLGDAHSATAAIGGNINGAGTFTIGAGGSANDITVSGVGQINAPFTVDVNTKTVTFTQLTTVGNNLTLTSGGLTTTSLQLINGTVTLDNASVLTLNTTSVSITNTTSLNNTSQLKGSSNVTISGVLDQDDDSVIDMTGTLTASSYDA